jgi:putative membrane protein
MGPLDFPSINATLNGCCAVLLVVGYLAIRRGQVTLHKSCMLTALAVSAAFLASYLYYHIVVRGGQSTRFEGPPGVRTVYLAILIPHIVLAIVALPLELWVTYLGLKDRLEKHRRLARWTLPIWLYVSITGVVVYWMLYRLYPPAMEPIQ